MENPYDWDNETLLKGFMRACAKAGVSGSGLCYDPFAHYDHAEALFLKGVVLAKMEGARPPFKPSDNVVTTSERRTWPQGGLQSDLIPPGEIVKVVRIQYDGKGVWKVGIRGHENLLYRTEDFSLVPPKVNPPDDAA